ncbi:hypothetical protein BGZ65_002597 [Modicella reniformis]|uniref:F-box domain-containing protein n=1 Tax=Modicella reniformis TaxID=1440133 RepID=A0A9P6STS9_9FUNG|nr:hypothetical protein BGZ65_002597 [Modicella reniformis]
MADTDKDQVKVSDKAITMAPPEVLSKIFSFLDQRSLRVCLLVSHDWRACSEPVIWRTYSITTTDFVNLFNEPDKDKFAININEVFFKNCHHIRFLNISDVHGAADTTNLGSWEHLEKSLPHFKYHLPSVAPGAVLAANPGIRELRWDTGDLTLGNEFVFLLKRASRDLKKLSIVGNFEGQEHFIIKYLIKGDKEEEEEAGPPAIAQGDNDNGDTVDFKLEELTLKETIYSPFGNSVLNVKVLCDIPGVLPIRSLTILDFRTIQFSNEPYQQYDSLLNILRKCPNLEKLCVSFDMSSIPDSSSESFLRSHPYFSFLPFDPYLIIKQDDFVDVMYSSCPKLREIEFGMARQFTREHWVAMIADYGSQLESLSVWGDVSKFDDTVFMAMMDPSTSHPPRDRLHCLTRLNINGMKHLHECAWMPLKHLPQLKEFRARGVPLDATKLITKGEDAWTCKGLEILEIFVAIPKRAQWNCGNQEMVTGWWQKVKLSCQEDVLEKSNQIQIKVCEMIGRLTQLRELRIEGERSTLFQCICLELTLETGLDRLAPLQKNLEKLIVSALDEKLCGRREVEWIAQNWIHHQNRRWLERHSPISSRSPSSSSSPDKNGKSEQTSCTGTELDDDGGSFPSPKLKELIGISTQSSTSYQSEEEARSNIEWLKDQCPTLRVCAL